MDTAWPPNIGVDEQAVSIYNGLQHNRIIVLAVKIIFFGLLRGFNRDVGAVNSACCLGEFVSRVEFFNNILGGNEIEMGK